ncbi:MAG: efflux transporter outer membrane subunit [Massilia sp.]|nr:efflux transporter outer membrane subunit [Massilia sp.]
MKMVQTLFAAAAPLALCACALAPPAPRVSTPAPPAWLAAPAHNGNLTDLASWWQRQGDPLLVQLIASAQAASPSVSTARSRIAQARFERVAAGAALLPSVDGVASIGRMSQQSALPTGTTAQGALQASWEIDLFGTRRYERGAADARLAGAQAGWHEARVSVAAEVANQYYALRACTQLLAVAEQDAASRADTARLTGLTTQAGFQSPATAARARASAAEGNGRATLQGALCELDVKALVALTALPEPELRAQLTAATLLPVAPIAISALPAHTLAQRPDVYSAEREVAAASFDVGSAQGQRYPRLSLQGSVGLAHFRASGASTSFDTWSIGPLALSVPLFDAGRRSASLAAAEARYDSAVITYRFVVRQAVREVEAALVNLRSAAGRAGDAQTALDGYRYAFNATEALYKNGLTSLLELEDARRTRLAAENAVVTLERERNGAWIALYRAAGGGWSASANANVIASATDRP